MHSSRQNFWPKISGGEMALLNNGRRLSLQGCVFQATGGEVPMAERNEGSVTQWLVGVKEGDQESAQKLWERYFASLVRLAQAKLRSVRGGHADEEDAALSAFDSFCASA